MRVPIVSVALAIIVCLGENPGIDDQARVFSPQAEAAARKMIATIRETTGCGVLVYTLDSMPGEDGREALFASANGRETFRGLFIVISKADRKSFVAATESSATVFTPERLGEIRNWVALSLRNGAYDEALAGALGLAQARPQAPSSGPPAYGIRDRAKIFGVEARNRAEEVLEKTYRENHWEVVVETVPSLQGRPLREVAERAMKAGKEPHGVFVLIAREERRSCILIPHEGADLFSRPRVDELSQTLDDNLNVHQYTKGLLATLNKIHGLTEPRATALRMGLVTILPGATPSATVTPSGVSATGKEARPLASDKASGGFGSEITRGKVLAATVAAMTLSWLGYRAFRRISGPDLAGSERTS